MHAYMYVSASGTHNNPKLIKEGSCYSNLLLHHGCQCSATWSTRLLIPQQVTVDQTGNGCILSHRHRGPPLEGGQHTAAKPCPTHMQVR